MGDPGGRNLPVSGTTTFAPNNPGEPDNAAQLAISLAEAAVMAEVAMRNSASGRQRWLPGDGGGSGSAMTRNVSNSAAAISPVVRRHLYDNLNSIRVADGSLYLLPDGQGEIDMAGITPERIGELIDEAPAWAKIALTQPNDRLPADAIVTLGNHIYHSLFRVVEVNRAQLPLPL